jgi:DNA-binding CsgD family transcriptional regulator
MTRDEIAALWGIDPEAVRSTLRRYGITEVRGYPREAVEAVERPGQGRRTDLIRRTPSSEQE